jgi:hypothetical protein
MRIRRRISSASSSDFSPGAAFAQSSWPKYAKCAPGGDDQRVVVDRAAVRQQHLPRVDVDADRLAEQHGRVLALAEDRPQRLGDLARAQRASRDLVEQRLEEVEVAAIDERQRDLRLAAEDPGRVQAGEPAANDEHAMPPVGRGGRLRLHLALSLSAAARRANGRASS